MLQNYTHACEFWFAVTTTWPTEERQLTEKLKGFHFLSES